MAKDTFWFPHDCNAADDDKTMILIDQLGLEGYGIYWVLIEKLREREDFKMPFNTIPIMARRYGTTAEKMKTVVTQFGLFEYDENGFFFSQSLVNRMQKWIDKKEKLSIAGKISAQKRLKNSTNVQQMPNKCSTNVQQTFNKCSTIIEENITEQNIIEDKIIEDKIEEEKDASFDASHSQSNNEIEFVEVEEVQSVDTTSVAVIEKPEKVARAKKFDFKGALISVGICEEYANAWMEVRKSKKATNSEQAFKMLCNEFSKAFYASGMSTNECAEWAIKRDWKGFDYKWVENDLNKNSNGKNIKPYHVQYKEQRLAEIAQDIVATSQRARDNYYSGKIDRGEIDEDIPI